MGFLAILGRPFPPLRIAGLPFQGFSQHGEDRKGSRIVGWHWGELGTLGSLDRPQGAVMAPYSLPWITGIKSTSFSSGRPS